MDVECSELTPSISSLFIADHRKTSWGSRPDGDADDNERMTPQVLPAEVMKTPSLAKKRLVRYVDEDLSESDTALPVYEKEESRPPIYLTSDVTEDVTFKDR